VDPTTDHDSFDRKECSLILFEISFCRDLGLHDKRTKKTEKYHPLLCALRRYWSRVDIVCIPIDYAGTTLNNTASNIATALGKVRPSSDVKGKSKLPKTQKPRKTSVIHDKQVAKTFLVKICGTAQTRLLDIIENINQKIKDHAHTNNIRNTQKAINEVPIHHLLSTPRPLSTSIA
jgi:hypothetical protein